MTYVSDKLDQFNLDEILTSVRASLRSGKLDSHPQEVEYLRWVLSLRDFEQFKAERDRVYREYDEYCDRLVPVLEMAEPLPHAQRLQVIAPHFLELFYLDGRRRGLGGAFNDPESIAQQSEQRFRSFVLRFVPPLEADGLVREVIVNALALELPFDVQTTRALLQTIVTLQLRPADFELQRLVARLREQLDICRDEIERYARGSIVTFARKLMKYAKVCEAAPAHLAQIEQSRAAGLRRKEAAFAQLHKYVDATAWPELDEHVRIVTALAWCNGVEDVQRRVALDRFEEYLVRLFVTESMHALGMIDSPDPFAHGQPDLVAQLEHAVEART